MDSFHSSKHFYFQKPAHSGLSGNSHVNGSQIIRKLITVSWHIHLASVQTLLIPSQPCCSNSESFSVQAITRVGSCPWNFKLQLFVIAPCSLGPLKQCQVNALFLHKSAFCFLKWSPHPIVCFYCNGVYTAWVLSVHLWFSSVVEPFLFPWLCQWWHLA